MAITVYQLPSGSYLAARNRQKYILSTDNYITTPGSPYTNQLSFTAGQPANNETLSFEFNGETVVLTFKTTAVADTDVHIKATLALTLEELLAVAQRQYLLTDNYYFSTSGIDFFVTARENGPVWDIDFTGSTAATGASPVSGVADVVEETFRFYLVPFLFNGSYYDKIIDLTASPDTDQRAEFDLMEILLAQLSYDLPGYNASSVSQGSNSLKQILLRYWEYYDDAFHNGGEMSVIYAHLGGVLEKETTTINYSQTYFTHATLQRFLTRHPRAGQVVTQTQQAFLYLYQKTGLGDLFIRLIIEYTDNSTATTVEKKYTVNQPGSIVIIPAGYAQLTIDTHKTTGKTVARWYIQGWYGLDFPSATATTEAYGFTPDTGYYPNNRYFLTGNSVGGFDSLWCTGVASKELDVTGEDYSVNPPDNSSTKVFGAGAQNRALIDRVTKVSTGWMDKARVDFYSAELAASEEVYEVTGGQYVKIKVDRSSIKELYDDDTENYGFSFSYTPAQEDRV